ncbi:hypothetical protein BDZ45DRAFT_733536 [Acephala macrosclerotiorum]|nr:hypothetical protein BDZ45DRAFT_733536 [Acephala macrosclerotiorum]
MFSQSCQQHSLEPGRLDLDSGTGEVNELFNLHPPWSSRFLDNWGRGLDEVSYNTGLIFGTFEFYGTNIAAPHNYLHTGLSDDLSMFAPLPPSLEVAQDVFPDTWQDSHSLNAGLAFSPSENFSPTSKAMESPLTPLPPSLEVTQDVFPDTWPGSHSWNTVPGFSPSENFSPTSKAMESPSTPLPQTPAFNAPSLGVHSCKQHRSGGTSWSSNHISQCSHRTSSRAVLRDAIVNRLMTNATPRILDAIENEMIRLDPDCLNSGGTAGESKL